MSFKGATPLQDECLREMLLELHYMRERGRVGESMLDSQPWTTYWGARWDETWLGEARREARQAPVRCVPPQRGTTEGKG